MQSYDLFMLLIVAATTVWGLWKGFSWQVASLTSVFSSYGVSYSLRAPVAKMIDAEPPLNMFIAMLVIYVLMSLVTWVGFGLISTTISSLKLHDFDRQIGGLIGAAKGAVVCIVITFFAVTLSPPATQEAICQSRSGRYIAIALRNSGSLIPPEMHAVVDPYLNTLQNKLAQHQGEPVNAAPDPAVQQVEQWAQWANHAWQQQQQQYAAQQANNQGYAQQPQYGNQYSNQYGTQYDPRYGNQQQYYPPPAATYADPRYNQPPVYPNPQYANPYPNPQYANPQYPAQPQYADPRYAQPQYDPRYAQPQYANPQYANPQQEQPQQPTYGRRLNNGVEGQPPTGQPSNQWR